MICAWKRKVDSSFCLILPNIGLIYVGLCCVLQSPILSSDSLRTFFTSLLKNWDPSFNPAKIRSYTLLIKFMNECYMIENWLYCILNIEVYLYISTTSNVLLFPRWPADGVYSVNKRRELYCLLNNINQRKNI